jgi:hypothetical protein
MTSYSIPDVTGVNPDYLQVNIGFYVYQAGVKISFVNSPVFAESLVIKLTDKSGITLDRDIDWTVNTDDIDQMAMSQAHLSDTNFTKTLVKSITLISNKALHKAVAMTYQEFYLTAPGRTFDDGRPIEFSPDILKQLMSGLSEVRQQLAGVTSPVATTLGAPALLPLDINKQLIGNVITNEVTTVNTVVGAKVIRPLQGAYFADSLVLTHAGTTLQPTTDYIPIVTSPMTKQSTNTSGIYQFILLVGSFTGDITYTYHALGGEVQQEDIKSVYQSIAAVQTYLTDGAFITADTITTTPSFRAFNARLNALETNMRTLLSGAPTYGDATAGITTTRAIAASDSNFHWYNIAKLYQVTGSTDIVTADQFKGRVYLPGSKVAITFTVDFNLFQTRNTASFKTESLVFDPLYTLFTDISVSAPVYPQLRVVWNNVGGVFSGALLQFGIPLTALSDQMVVEDMSTTESCWVLDRTNEIVTGVTPVNNSPKDSGFLLPDTTSTWSSAGGNSYSNTYTPPYDEGYLVYAGSSVTLNNINTSASTTGLFTSVLPSYIQVSKVKQIIVTLTSANGNIIYDTVVPMTRASGSVRTGAAISTASNGYIAEMSATLTQVVGGNSTVSLNLVDTSISLLTSLSTNMTDIIRYIRVKV